MKYTDVMIDLETLGSNPQAAIVAIGLYFFNLDNDECVERQYYISTNGIKGQIDASTVAWWLQQSQEARDALVTGLGRGMGEKATALKIVDDFYNFTDTDRVCVWGNGANFDITILESLFRRVNEPAPWKFYNVRCYRTMKSVYKHIKAPQENSLQHDALADARYQALHLKRILSVR